ncbi:hypothetical protein FHS18_000933 [Paenibacillus phyllosphaerae]|uniref:Uncharacterized protein n=1 Tax=Paenibacillus phyllosphaerae TaxID=274593 RepID=A0A7W5FL77_9BACL|nr:hypothetical protein [Paenibacillus phyllosphaerae]MBB3108881.1 hypothetical protein [Paenibacillus phyllosphaerae]
MRMRQRLEEFKAQLIEENLLEGHEDVLLAFEHLLDEVDAHEKEHIITSAKLGIAGYKTDRSAEETFREDMSWLRQAAYRVIERTVADLINKGNKHWQKFYDQVE